MWAWIVHERCDVKREGWKEREVQERREKKRRRNHAKRHIHFWSTFTSIKIDLLFSFSSTDFALCIDVLENLLLFSLYFGCSQNHLRWFVEKHRFKLRIDTQTRLTTRSLKPSSSLENITTNDLRRSIETINQSLSTLIWSIFTLIILRNCEESQSLSMFVLWWFCSRHESSRYCKIVDIDLYYTLKRSTESRIKNFFHWLCNNYSVKKISSIEIYWHQLSQLYIKWKNRRINSLILKQIFDVSDRKHRCFDMINREIVHQWFTSWRTRSERQRNWQVSLERERFSEDFALSLSDEHKHLFSWTTMNSTCDDLADRCVHWILIQSSSRNHLSRLESVRSTR